MKSHSASFPTRVASVVLVSALSLLVAGCGIEASTGEPAVPMAAISGIIHGGPNPVKYSNITLWETVTAGIPHSVGGTAASSGYGSTAQILASTTSDGFGSFSFNPSTPYVCDAGEYAYITSTGGYTGSNTANGNSVEMAVIGPCSSLSVANRANTSIYMSEVSTVAAAYALGNFITEDPSYQGAGLQRVYIGAPASKQFRNAGLHRNAVDRLHRERPWPRLPERDGAGGRGTRQRKPERPHQRRADD